MTSASQLVPGGAAPSPLRLEPAGVESAALLGSLWRRVGTPHGWTERLAWTDADWAAELGQPQILAWVARVDGEAVGFTEFEVEAGGSVGILFFGLVPEYAGRGFGGDFLTQVVRLAWAVVLGDGSTPHRVWLKTSSRDHPNALPNYQARGFRVCRVERRPIPGA
jgi:ribosomal protein S18 acetylase RimI-like enzyme